MLLRASLLIALCCLLDGVKGHARLFEPPSRASMWKFGFSNPTQTTDNGANCGGASVSIVKEPQLVLWRSLCKYGGGASVSIVEKPLLVLWRSLC